MPGAEQPGSLAINVAEAYLDSVVAGLSVRHIKLKCKACFIQGYELVSIVLECDLNLVVFIILHWS